MIGTMIGIILVILVLGVVWWAIQQLLPLIPIAEPFRTILRVLCVVLLVVVVIWVIIQLLAVGGIYVPNLAGARPLR